MKGIEKILEEVNRLIEKHKNNAYELVAKEPLTQCYTETDIEQTKVHELAVVRDIIRKHMNDGWIPVDERLPENNKLVLVWARSTARGADEWSLGSYDNGFWALGSWGGSLVFPSQLEAVAWCPLPEPYRPERRTPDD